MKPDRIDLMGRRLLHSMDEIGSRIRGMVFVGIMIGAVTVGAAFFVPPVIASHQGHESHAGEDSHDVAGTGHPIPGASFQVFIAKGKETAESAALEQTQADEAIKTVVDALSFMIQHRTDYPRFDESVTRNLLEQVVVEPKVVNREGKEFPFLVARTNEPGRVRLLISASSLKDKGYLGHPEQLVPVLAREFQWVVSKADTAPKSNTVSLERDLKHAPIRTNREIGELSAEERARLLQQLFGSYLTTVDDQKSLEGQPFYEVGTTKLVQPAQPDSTIKLYDIRIREALQTIVRDPSFEQQTPKAVRSLLNGKIWNVSFVKIDQRDWATRTRVLPEEQSVLVGERERSVQPAKILVNTYRTAAPDDPFYADTKGLPMGALSADQLARVIALEIERNIVEKSMKGHVAQDENKGGTKE
ncbi:hypothetical protein DNFV4_01968 [Nitrospira tepida]|uniref:Uncharacterized protein n=1 Tax=Nitrospira tepida TaxID=2973512 RepID=A0AA86MZ11_9BACT|nr:hypothetical protein [Nitrospira tepida]CAI4031549.1 hypothetical protein DNFV4_01968 [Nitrospira tepida]